MNCVGHSQELHEPKKKKSLLEGTARPDQSVLSSGGRRGGDSGWNRAGLFRMTPPRVVGAGTQLGGGGSGDMASWPVSGAAGIVLC